MCDCAVALGSSTARGSTLFGKNSDRPASEPQPIRWFPRTEHATQARVRCTYVEVPQARETAAVLGSGPFWIWGLEQGVNEHGVVIGNESVWTHQELELPERGLLGMDLVRLGLERARNAAEALSSMTHLIESHGQGGNGFFQGNLPYSSGFLIADPSEAWSLQTSSTHWAAKRVDGLESLSNHPSIGSDWDLLSESAESYARERGWLSETEQRFDFEASYRSTRLLPRAFSDGRLRRSRSLLGERRGALHEHDLLRLLRDHGGRSPRPMGKDKQDEAYYTLCAHNEVQGDTAASMIVALDRPTRWFALGTPCTSVYLPLYLDGKIPETLLHAQEQADQASAWWQFKNLQRAVEEDYEARAPQVRAVFDEFEHDWLERAAQSDDPGARMEQATAEALAKARSLLRSF